MSSGVKPADLFIVYQRVLKWQKVIVMIPASISTWVDTCLHPSIIGTRSLLVSWRSRVAYNSEKEDVNVFRERMSDVRVRFIPDETVVIDQRIYTVVDDDSPVIPAWKEVRLPRDEHILLRFPMERGRIKVHLAGAKPDDQGIVKIDFITQLAAADDNIVFPGTVDSVEFYELDTEQFPEPRKPNPFAGMLE